MTHRQMSLVFLWKKISLHIIMIQFGNFSTVHRLLVNCGVWTKPVVIPAMSETCGDFGISPLSYTVQIGERTHELPGCSHICEKVVTERRCCPNFWGPLCLRKYLSLRICACYFTNNGIWSTPTTKLCWKCPLTVSDIIHINIFKLCETFYFLACTVGSSR